MAGIRLLPDFAPPQFAARGTLWYMARTLFFMLKTNGAAKMVISEALKATLAGSPGNSGQGGDAAGIGSGGGGCIAMHIRRQHRSCKEYGQTGNDSGSADAALCIPLTRYMDEVTAMVERYNVTTVVLASDSQHAVDACQAKPYRCVALQVDRHDGGGGGEGEGSGAGGGGGEAASAAVRWSRRWLLSAQPSAAAHMLGARATRTTRRRGRARALLAAKGKLGVGCRVQGVGCRV
jgi:hypothetical protein